MHKVIMKTIGLKIKVDHINGNTLDNRKQNLRLCTNQQNQMNQKTQVSTRKTSTYKGVKLHKSRWYSRIRLNKKDIHIGCFDTELEAAKAYDKKASELFGEFAKLNFEVENNMGSPTNRPTLVVLNVIYKDYFEQGRNPGTENLYLIGKHKGGNKENLYAFPGGKVEFETVEKAFFRELEEETGLQKIVNDNSRQLQYLGFHEVELRNKKFFNMIFAYPYQGLKGEPRAVEPHKHYNWEWLTLEEIKKLPLASSTKDFIDNMEWQLHDNEC